MKTLQKITHRNWLTPVLFAGAFGLLSSLPVPRASASYEPSAGLTTQAARGGGAFKHKIYIGKNKGKLGLAPADGALNLITHYGG